MPDLGSGRQLPRTESRRARSRSTKPRRYRVIKLAKFSIKRPRAALSVWAALAAVLAVIGFGVASTLSPPISVVPGTQSSRAQQFANAKFGPTQLVPILLEGPHAQLNRQGPPLVVALARGRIRVSSRPGTPAAPARGFVPGPTAAMIIVSVDRSEKDAVRYDQPQIQELVSGRSRRRSSRTSPASPRSTARAKRFDVQPASRRAHRSGDPLHAAAVGLRAPVAALAVTAVGGSACWRDSAWSRCSAMSSRSIPSASPRGP